MKTNMVDTRDALLLERQHHTKPQTPASKTKVIMALTGAGLKRIDLCTNEQNLFQYVVCSLFGKLKKSFLIYPHHQSHIRFGM